MSLQGIYLIKNKINGNVYVGQSKNMEVRWDYHKRDLYVGNHHQKNLQNEFNDMVNIISEQFKYNELYNYIDFKKLTIDRCYEFTPYKLVEHYSEESILKLEDKIILEQRAIRQGYNQMTNVEIKNMLCKIENEKESWNNNLGKIKKEVKEHNKIFENDKLTILANDGEKEVLIKIKELNDHEKYCGNYLFFKFVEYYKKKLGENINEFEINSSLKEIQEFAHDYSNYWFYNDDKFITRFAGESYRKDTQIALYNKITKGFSYDIKSFRKGSKLIAKVNYEEFKRFTYEYFTNKIK